MADRTPVQGQEPVSSAEQWRRTMRRRWLIQQGRDPENPADQAWMDSLTTVLDSIPLDPPKPPPAPRAGYPRKPRARKLKDPKVIRPEGPCSLYKAYDSLGALLYVGITARGVWRARQHGYRSTWWPKMARMEWEHFGSREEALERETTLIYALDPIYNEVRPTPWKERNR